MIIALGASLEAFFISSAQIPESALLIRGRQWRRKKGLGSRKVLLLPKNNLRLNTKSNRKDQLMNGLTRHMGRRVVTTHTERALQEPEYLNGFGVRRSLLGGNWSSEIGPGSSSSPTTSLASRIIMRIRKALLRKESLLLQSRC